MQRRSSCSSCRGYIIGHVGSTLKVGWICDVAQADDSDVRLRREHVRSISHVNRYTSSYCGTAPAGDGDAQLLHEHGARVDALLAALRAHGAGRRLR